MVYAIESAVEFMLKNGLFWQRQLRAPMKLPLIPECLLCVYSVSREQEYLVGENGAQWGAVK